MTQVTAPSQPRNFEEALAELENLVASMEGGQLSLEASLAAYKRGAELLQYCQSTLQNAQQQVRILEDNALQNFPGADDGR
jgi:exodeoxyribonuclease VII small subunit